MIHYKVGYNFSVFAESIKLGVSDCEIEKEDGAKSEYITSLTNKLNAIKYEGAEITNLDNSQTKFYQCKNGFIDLSIVYDVIFKEKHILDLSKEVTPQINNLKGEDSEIDFIFQNYDINNQNFNATTDISFNSASESTTNTQIMKLTISGSVNPTQIVEIAKLYGGEDVKYHTFKEGFTNVSRFAYEGFSNSNYYNLRENFNEEENIVIIKSSNFQPDDIINKTLTSKYPEVTVSASPQDLIPEIIFPNLDNKEINFEIHKLKHSEEDIETTTEFPLQMKHKIVGLPELLEFLNFPARNKLINEDSVNIYTADNLPFVLNEDFSDLNEKSSDDFFNKENGEFFIEGNFSLEDIKRRRISIQNF